MKRESSGEIMIDDSSDRPILFLDIDGVLNGMSLEFDDSPRVTTTLERKSKHMLPDHVARLTRVLRETGCDVVVSSTWRMRFTPRQIARMLTMQGMPAVLAVRFVGATDEEPVPYDWPCRGGRQRGLQIARWLNTARRLPVTKFAIIDDDNDMAHLASHLVQTDTMIGMTNADADRLIELLLLDFWD